MSPRPQRPQDTSFNYTRLAARMSARAVMRHFIAFALIDLGLFQLYNYKLITFGSLTVYGHTLSPTTLAFTVGAIIIVFEIIYMIHSGAATSRYIRKGLAPLQQLLTATEAFSGASLSPSGRYSPEALKDLAAALDAVEADHIGDRIPTGVVAEELRPLTAAINQMLARIDEAYGEQRRFVSDASHELRTPIAVIQGYANLLLRWGSEDPATLRESLVAIKDEADNMKQLLNQLLFLARGDNDSLKLDWQTVCLSDIAEEAVREARMMGEQLPEKSERIFETAIDGGIYIYGDTGLLKQLIRILIDNGMKYSDTDKPLRVKLARMNGQALLSVSDEGSGIPAALLPHIFDRFVRADESRTRNAGGAGLGLSIAKWICERHSGSIEVVSREGVGSKFTVALPAFEAKEPPAGY